jgi:ribosomal protein L7/L12
MNEQEYSRRLDHLVTRVNQMEAMLQQLLIRLNIDPAELRPPEPPELRAVREALQSGDKLKAIKLYRSLYNVGLQEAQDAINAM